MNIVSDLRIQFGRRVLFHEVNMKFIAGNCYRVTGAIEQGNQLF